MSIEKERTANGTKQRILYLYQYLVRNTDPEHPESTVDLTKMLMERYGIQVSRNTISDDLTVLHDCGLHIEHYESTQNKYYYDGWVYELPELKILIDAISSSRFITQRKSDELITKLLTLTTEENARKLRRHVYVTGRVKSDNENGYYIVDAVNDAIDAKRKISFCYSDYDVEKNRFETNNGEPYTVSPYSLVWDGDYYYMRGYCDERHAMRNFRVDRIEGHLKVLNEIAVMAPEGYNPVDYSKSVFRMLDSDEPVQVKLFCHVSAMKYLIDNFGQNVSTERADDDHFTANILVCTSLTFYRWVFGFNGRIRIIEPNCVASEYRQLLETAMKDYL